MWWFSTIIDEENNDVGNVESIDTNLLLEIREVVKCHKIALKMCVKFPTFFKTFFSAHFVVV